MGAHDEIIPTLPWIALGEKSDARVLLPIPQEVRVHCTCGRGWGSFGVRTSWTNTP
jgi:hypothetical protein